MKKQTNTYFLKVSNEEVDKFSEIVLRLKLDCYLACYYNDGSREYRVRCNEEEYTMIRLSSVCEYTHGIIPSSDTPWLEF